jgi:hypothetical protein
VEKILNAQAHGRDVFARFKVDRILEAYVSIKKCGK